MLDFFEYTYVVILIIIIKHAQGGITIKYYIPTPSGRIYENS